MSYKSENERILEFIEKVDEVRRESDSRRGRVVRRIQSEFSPEELEATRDQIRKALQAVSMDDQELDKLDTFRQEAEKAARRGPALIDPLNPPEARGLRYLDLENDLRSMKEDILDALESEAASLLGAKLLTLQPATRVDL